MWQSGAGASCDMGVGRMAGDRAERREAERSCGSAKGGRREGTCCFLTGGQCHCGFDSLPQEENWAEGTTGVMFGNTLSMPTLHGVLFNTAHVHSAGSRALLVQGWMLA